MSYQPPHIRNKRTNDFKPKWQVEKEREEERKKLAEQQNLLDNDKNFPTLGKGIVKQTTWNAKSFAVLATEWNEHEESEKTIKEIQKREQDSFDKEMYLNVENNFTLPTFQNIHRFVEEDEEEYEETPASGWQMVDRKKVKPRQQIDDRPSSPDDKQKNTDGTMWDAADQPEEYETCWDERRY